MEMETREFLFGISADSSTASSFDPATGVVESFDVYPFDYNSLQSTAEEIFIQILERLPPGAVPGCTVWTGNFSDEEKQQLLQVADDYNFNTIHFINVEGAWALHLLSQYNKPLQDNDKIGLILDLGKVVEGNLFRVVDGLLVRVRITSQTSCGLDRLTRKLFELFRGNFIRGRKCETILVEQLGEPLNYPKYFNKRTVISVPYTRYSTSKGGLVRARVLCGDPALARYDLVTKLDKTLDVIDYDSAPSSPPTELEQLAAIHIQG